ncbi:hypothetical protein E8E12_009898 [Didymella heteroderae]|uniref:Aminoglycoside phosphotransferase domain-containing protein n=1 Tax=Didymella heteroderae TaxID=1769908 RepID=A0A9P4WUX3_9PLEO|nr:hypothetical protein E8E12_009898 [Didymella heteroderae]
MTTLQVSPKTALDGLDVEISPKTNRIDADHTDKPPRRDKSAYDFKERADVRSFLEEHYQLTNFNIESLLGGTANYVYRVTENDTEATRIIKHAAPQLASNHSFSLSPERMDFEADMLMKRSEDKGECHCSTVQGFNTSTIEKTHVHTAHFESYERDIKLLCIEDGGNKNLKDAYKDLSPAEIQDIGTELGKWLANLHSRTPLSNVSGAESGRNNSTGVAIAGYIYKNLIGTVKMFCDAVGAGTLSNKALADHLQPYSDPEKLGRLSKRIDKHADDVIGSTRKSVCHGDFWPGNILLRSNTASKSHILTVVDWELARIGNSATDIGQFAAEAMILDLVNNNHHEEGLCAAFMRAYFKTSAVDIGSKESLYAWMTQIAIHYAVHLIVWPHRKVHWAPKEESATLAVHGLSVLENAFSTAPDIKTWTVFSGLAGLEDIVSEFRLKRGDGADE